MTMLFVGGGFATGFGFYLEKLAMEESALRETILVLKQKNEIQKIDSPDISALNELKLQVQVYQDHVNRLVLSNDALMQAALEMPELKSEKYRKPYQNLYSRIQEMNSIISKFENNAENELDFSKISSQN